MLVLLVKVFVAVSTGSLAVLGDAIHSLTDVANNVAAWIVMRLSGQPADRDHPYGHRKFETLAVFGLATLLAVMALELGLHALRRGTAVVIESPEALGLMLCVLAVNVALATWQRSWARRLQSDLLLADANHTFADVLTTIVVIAGWQLSAPGYPRLDTLSALVVAGFVLHLAYGLFRRTLPTLVDAAAIEPERILPAVRAVPGIRSVARIRSRWVGSTPAIDLVISVAADHTTTAAHHIAEVEQLL